VLLTEQGTQHAIALDLVNHTRDPFSLLNPFNLSSDQRRRVSLFVWHLGLLPGDTVASVTVVARDDEGRTYNLPVESLTAADFEFLTGSSNNLATWTAAPVPQSIDVFPGMGQDGSDRVTIIWPDGAIKNQWLRVTVRANERTGLAESDISYFGNAIGESGNLAGNAIVNATDEIMARNFYHGALDPAAIDDPYDYNRDGLVNGTDQIIARNNQTNPLTMLRLITAPAVDAVVRQALEEDTAAGGPAPAELQWLLEFERMNSRDHNAKKAQTAATAVDELLATYGL